MSILPEITLTWYRFTPLYEIYEQYECLFLFKLSLIVAQEEKRFLIFEPKDSLRMVRIFPRKLAAGPEISTYFIIFSGFTELILSLLLITLIILIKSPFIGLSSNFVTQHTHSMALQGKHTNNSKARRSLLTNFPCLPSLPCYQHNPSS